MDIELIIRDHKFGLILVLALVVLLVILRAIGYDPKPPPNGSGDPIAEADFHMAYGLYDKAAQIIRYAMTDDPLSTDLNFKLLEIYFTSGDGDSFLAIARFYEDKFGRSGHWDEIRSMGQQLMPNERLFR